MKKVLALIVAIILSAGAMPNGLFTFSKVNSEEESVKAETPIAEIQNDDYVPYQSRQAASPSKEVAALSSGVEFVSVSKTITVMTTATGDTSRGNYIASKPIADALVRLDGVPRYTDNNGQITAPLTREYVELYVERNGYNPYIEVIEATEEEKVVYLKRPSDDIEIFSVMFDYSGESFNLMCQPCYYLKAQGVAAASLSVSANVAYDYVWFYVNDELVKFGFDDEMVFTDDELDSYNVDDKFSLKVSYQGIDSKMIELQLIIEEFDPQTVRRQMLQAARSGDNCSITAGNESSGTGEIASIFVDDREWWEILLDFVIPDIDVSYDIGPVSVSINFVVDVHNGTIQIIGGFKIDVVEAVKTIQKAHKDAENQRKSFMDVVEETYKEIENEMIETQKKVDEINAQISELEKSEQAAQEKIEALKAEREKVQKLRDANKPWKISDGYRKFQDEQGNFIKSVKGLTNELDKATNEYKNISDQIKNARDNGLESAKQNAYKALVKYLKDGKGFKQKVSKIKDVFKNKGTKGHKWGFDVEFSAMTLLEFSFRKLEVVEWSVFAELVFKPSFTYTWYVPAGPIVIPIFIKVEGLVGIKVKTFFVKDSKPMRFSEAMRQISWVLELGLRVDGGVGIPGIATAGIYGKVQFDYHFAPEDEWEWEWGAGVRLTFLIFDFEFGYASPKQKIPNSHKKTLAESSLRARAVSASTSISDNQVFDRMDQASRPQIISLSDGRQLLLWIEDDETRDTYNRSVLKYAIYDNGVWSEPQVAIDNGKSDFDFDIYADEDDVFIAVQKANDVLTDEDTIDTAMSKLEIFVAKFNTATNKFENATQLTDNNVYDAMPQFAVGDEPMVLWQTNTNNDYLGLTGENIVYSSAIVGNSWSVAKERFRNNTTIYSYAAAIKDGSFSIAVCDDADGDILTPEAKTVVMRDQEVVFESDTAANPKFIQMPEGSALMYYSEGRLMITEDYNNEAVVIDGVCSQDYNVGKSTAAPIVFYEAYDGELEKGYCALYTNGAWTSNIAVTNETNTSADISAITGYYSNGLIHTAYNYKTVDTENYADTPMVLCVAEHERGYKIYTEANAISGINKGAETSIMLYIENIGDFDITEFVVSLCGQDIKIICAEPLKIGEDRSFEVVFNAIFDDEEYISIRTVVEGDDNNVLADDEYLLFVKYTDIDVQFTREIVNGKQTFVVNAENVSDIDSGIRIRVYVNGELDREQAVVLTPGEKTEYSIIFDEINAGDYVYIAVEADEDEYNISDNTVGFYSLQTEKLSTEIALNPYAEALQSAKQFVM